MIATLMLFAGTTLICVGIAITIWPASLAAFLASLIAAAVDVQTPQTEKPSSATMYFLYNFAAGMSAFIAIHIAGHPSHFTQPPAIFAAILISSGVFLWTKLFQRISTSATRGANE